MRFDVKDVLVSSYSVGGSQKAPVLPMEDLTIDYTPIDPTYSRDTFVFTDDGTVTLDKPRFEWIEIKRPPKPPSDEVDDPVVTDFEIQPQGPEPVPTLLLPAVTSACDDVVEPPVWDDFMFG